MLATSTTAWYQSPARRSGGSAPAIRQGDTMEQKANTHGIWHEFHERLLSFIAGRVQTVADAEDILQDVFVRLHKHRDRLDEIENVTAWVYRITRNAITDHHRARATASGAMARVAEESKTALQSGSNLEAEELDVDLAGCVGTLVKQLPETYVEAVELTEIQGTTQKDAAERLGLSVSGMKSRVQRGRAKLKGLLMDCCHWELDVRGAVIEVEPHSDTGCGNDCKCK